MKLIENWNNKNLACHFCGTDKSVKYSVNVFDPTISNKETEVCCCNKCAIIYKPLKARK